MVYFRDEGLLSLPRKADFHSTASGICKGIGRSFYGRWETNSKYLDFHLLRNLFLERVVGKDEMHKHFSTFPGPCHMIRE